MTKEIIVQGNVQGVFYRKNTREKAKELNLTGTVENEPNGDVRIIVTGPEEQINTLETWCHTGSAAAEVDQVDSEIVEEREFEDFTIKR